MLVGVAHPVDVDLARLELAALDLAPALAADDGPAEQLVGLVALVGAALAVLVRRVRHVRVERERRVAAVLRGGGAAAQDLAPGVDGPLRRRVELLEPVAQRPSQSLERVERP